MARKEITKSKAKEYRKACKKNKGRMLDEICDLTGWCRDHARKELKRAFYSNSKTKKKKIEDTNTPKNRR